MPFFDLLINQASIAGQVICVLLFLLSTYSWAVMASKLLSLRRMRRDTAHFLEMFRGQQHPLELFEMGHRFRHSGMAHIYRTACRELALFLKQTAHQTRRRPLGITPVQMECVNAAMDRAVGESAVRLEARTAGLATAVSGAPFLGLLGTVWGVMDTFSGLARDSGGATLQSIAPGVASALVTTVVGLLVAIPAMFGYNYIVSRIKFMVAGLDNFAAELQSVLTRQFASGLAMPADPAAAGHDQGEGNSELALNPDERAERLRPQRPFESVSASAFDEAQTP